MIEVTDIVPVHRNSLLAVCNVHIIPWKITLNEVKIFEKGANRWIGMPAREYITDTGEKKYVELVTFDTDAIKNRFRNQIMGVIDKFLETNPDMKMPDVITENDDLPF